MTAPRRFIPVLLLCLWVFSLWALLPFAARAQSVEVTDSAGRHVTIPATVERVMPAGPPAALLLYALAPDKLLGWPSKLPPETAALLPKAYAGLPVVGRLTSSKPPSAESIRKLHPDLILDIGDVEPGFAKLADKIQQETGIPYLLFDGHLAGTPDLLRKLGPLLGANVQATRLANYAEGLFQRLDAGLAKLPADQRPVVYYARGATGLQTGPAGSLLGEIVDMAGGRNPVPPTGSSQPRKTTLAEITAWNPDVVITQDASFYRSMPTAPGWSALRAAVSLHLYLAPSLPFGWMDEPPGINRLLGLRWLAHRLHPDIFTWGMHRSARDFIRLFYHADLTNAHIDQIVGSVP